jgi:hypothetical protein
VRLDDEAALAYTLICQKVKANPKVCPHLSVGHPQLALVVVSAVVVVVSVVVVSVAAFAAFLAAARRDTAPPAKKPVTLPTAAPTTAPITFPLFIRPPWAAALGVEMTPFPFNYLMPEYPSFLIEFWGISALIQKGVYGHCGRDSNRNHPEDGGYVLDCSH